MQNRQNNSRLRGANGCFAGYVCHICGRRGGAGREAVTKAKQRRISRGALAYMVQNGLIGQQARFDVIEIDGERLTHIRDAFAYQGEPF